MLYFVLLSFVKWLYLVVKMSDEKRSRWFNLLLYPDNPQHNLAIMQLQTTKYMACGICHNMDCYESDCETHLAGEIKKAHFHFILRCKNPRYKSGIAKELDIEPRFIDETSSLQGSAKYLLHFGDDTKYQYSPDDLVGNLKGDVLKLIENGEKISDCDFFFMLLDFLDSTHRRVTVRDVGVFLATNGGYKYFKCNFNICRELMYEHNEKYCNAPRI